MSTTTATDFKGVTHFGNDQLINMLEVNLKSYLDWSMLKIGGWVDISNTQADIWDGDTSQLRMVEDPSYTDGQVWQGMRKDWVWETGVNYSDVDSATQNPSGVGTPTVGGVATAESYSINYPLGRIVFDTAIATTSTVKTTHAYRNVQVYVADDVPWFRELQFRSYRSDDVQISETDSGEWSIGGQHRVQLPVVIIEGVSRGTSRAFEMGSGSLVIQQDVLFHVVSDSRYSRNNIVDIIRQQSDRAIWLFDTNLVNAGSGWPLDMDGALVGTKMYTDLVDTITNGGYQWNQCYMRNAVVSEIDTLYPKLFEGVVRMTMEIVLGGS